RHDCDRGHRSRPRETERREVHPRALEPLGHHLDDRRHGARVHSCAECPRHECRRAICTTTMPFDLSLAGKPGPTSVLTYSWKDTALYALGVGAKKEELDYLYEGRGPKVLPSFAVVPKFQPMLDLLAKSGGDLAMLVHSAERVTVHAPLEQI